MKVGVFSKLRYMNRFIYVLGSMVIKSRVQCNVVSKVASEHHLYLCLRTYGTNGPIYGGEIPSYLK